MLRFLLLSGFVFLLLNTVKPFSFGSSRSPTLHSLLNFVLQIINTILLQRVVVKNLYLVVFHWIVLTLTFLFLLEKIYQSTFLFLIQCEVGRF